MQKIEEPNKNYDLVLRKTHLNTLKTISNGIWKSSKEFDVDVYSSQKNSSMDRLVNENSLKKSLENDNFIIFEGLY